MPLFGYVGLSNGIPKIGAFFVTFCFSPLAPQTTDFEANFSHIQHSGSLEDYLHHFTKLACRSHDWSDSQLKNVFLGGLKDELRHDVHALQPPTLSEAKHFSLIFNAKNHARSFQGCTTYAKPSPTPSSSIFPLPPPPAHMPSTKSPHSTNSSTPFRSLT